MTDWKRRRLLLAAGGAPFLSWRAARAQPAQGVAVPGLPLLVAPRRALVIGNSAYRFGRLKNPANDARAISEQLQKSGFEVATGLDLPREEMLEAIHAHGASLTRDGAIGLFYFAGHGVQLVWRNYLLPIDATIDRLEDIEAKCVDVNALIARIAKAANPMNVIILDACRDNPFAADGKIEQKGLSQLDAPPDTLLAYATAPGNVASDGDGANGLYTEQLLREMNVPETKIEDVFKRVRLAVRRRSNGAQIPWESTSLEEDFWFLPPKEQLRLAQEEAERIRRAQQAERQRLAQIEQARREEAERLQRELEAERARLAEEERERHERLEREREAQLARVYEAELALWEKVSGSEQPGPLEEYLRRYPSGHFAELAQHELDTLLAKQGEKKVEIVTQAANPYAQGFARADTAFRIGDSYSYVQLAGDTRQEQRRFTIRVTDITESEVMFNNGALIVDRLGNAVKLPDGRRFTPRQDQPLEYAIGRKWTTRFAVRNSKGRGADSEFTFRITRRERITVPAGTFDCYVIEGDGWSITERGFRLRLGFKRWMAPDKVRRPIVTEQYRKVEDRVGAPRPSRRGQVGRILNNERAELTAYTQS